MLRSILKAFLVIAIFCFMISYHRYGDQVFINNFIAAVMPSSFHSKEHLRQVATILRQPKELAFLVNSSVIEFPKNFSFGVSTSAYQIEGAWNEDGKSPSVWDTFTHEHPELIADGTNNDVGPNSYHLYNNDIDAVNHVGFQHYRFSISWTRIMPNGSAVNQAGLAHYHKQIDALIARNIEPVITIFHWDLPQWLQNIGGATSPLFIDYFVAYADVVFNAYGSKVKKWITINEFYNYCIISYGFGKWAPAIKSPGVGDYLCGHNLLIAHAKAYHLYRDKYFLKFGGEVGVTLEGPYYMPKDSTVSADDHKRAMAYRYGWFAEPIFSSEGGYPQIMVDEIGNRSVIEGRPFSRLPTMTEDIKKLIRGTSDFFGINYYTSAYIVINKEVLDPREEPSWFKDSGIKESVDSNWKRAKTMWLYSVPQGLRHLLNWIKNNYKNPPVFITETGWSDDGEIEDEGRIDYFKSHLKAVAKAINEDNCNVVGYTAWSLMHSFEWNSGYTINFGLYNVNYSSPKLERIPKHSVVFFQGLIKDRFIARD